MKQILFIHSAGTQGPHEGSHGLVKYLRKVLGKNYEVRFPLMPEPDDPSYQRWKQKLEKELASLAGEVILAGHSLGGSVLLKYLSENTFKKTIRGLFLVAVPYWGKEDWEIDEFILREDFASMLPTIPQIYFYHSQDDEVVPFPHMKAYAMKLPQAFLRELEGNNHIFEDGIPALAEDIKNLEK